MPGPAVIGILLSLCSMLVVRERLPLKLDVDAEGRPLRIFKRLDDCPITAEIVARTPGHL